MSISKGEIIAEIETNKFIADIVAKADGFLLYAVDIGLKIQSGKLIAIIGTKEENKNIISIIRNSTTITKKDRKMFYEKISSQKSTFFLTYTKVDQSIEFGESIAINFEDYPQLKQLFEDKCPDYDFIDVAEFNWGIIPRLNHLTNIVIKKWYKNIGELVEEGQILADISAEFFDIKLKAYKTGILIRKCAEENQNVPNGCVLTVIIEEEYYENGMENMLTSIEISEFIQTHVPEVFLQLKPQIVDGDKTVNTECQHFDVLLTKM